MLCETTVQRASIRDASITLGDALVSLYVCVNIALFLSDPAHDFPIYIKCFTSWHLIFSMILSCFYSFSSSQPIQPHIHILKCYFNSAITHFPERKLSVASINNLWTKPQRTKMGIQWINGCSNESTSVIFLRNQDFPISIEGTRIRENSQLQQETPIKINKPTNKHTYTQSTSAITSSSSWSNNQSFLRVLSCGRQPPLDQL